MISASHSFIKITSTSFTTHIRHRILIILPRVDPIRILITNQQRAAVESSRQARDHSIHLGVGARGKGAGRAAENVARGGLGEGDDAGAGAGEVGVGEEAVFDAAGDVAEGGLGVDYEVFGCVAGPDLRGVSGLLVCTSLSTGSGDCGLLTLVDVVVPVSLEPRRIE
jgi:hypothetical protein